MLNNSRIFNLDVHKTHLNIQIRNIHVEGAIRNFIFIIGEISDNKFLQNIL